jgi:integrase
MNPVAVTPPKARRRPFLGEWVVAPSTVDVYKRHVLAFIKWQWRNDELAVEESDMDEVLLTYFHDLYESRGAQGKAISVNTIYGIYLYLPELKGRLPRSQQAIKGWSKRCIGNSAPPLTWELASALAVHLARQSCFRRHAIGVLLGFDCLLRVGELVGLHREDVADSHDPRLGTGGGRHAGPGALLRIRKSKTGRNQWVTIHDPQVRAMVMQLVAETKPGALLFPFSCAHFRAVFKRGCEELRLDRRYVPHSMRHGGATRFRHILGWSMEDVIERGRWASSKSAKTYIQAGIALLMSMAAPVGLVDLGNMLSGQLYKHIFGFNFLTS